MEQQPKHSTASDYRAWPKGQAFIYVSGRSEAAKLYHTAMQFVNTNIQQNYTKYFFLFCIK